MSTRKNASSTTSTITPFRRVQKSQTKVDLKTFYDDDENEDEDEDEDQQQQQPEKKKKKKGNTDGCIDGGEQLTFESIKPSQYIPKEHWRLDGCVIINGKRRFGKTTCLNSLLSDVWIFYKEAYVMTKTKHNRFWSQHVPEERIYPDVIWDIADNILERQKKDYLAAQQTGQLTELPYVLLILDDVISSVNEMLYSEKLLQLGFEGRHYRLCIAVLTQDLKGVPPRFRQNCDQIFLTYQTQRRQIDTILEDFAGFAWATKQEFRKLIMAHTQEYQLLIIDQAEARRNTSEIFYVYLPDPDPPKYRLGDGKFWAESRCSWENQLKIWENTKKINIKAMPNEANVLALAKKHHKLHPYHKNPQSNMKRDADGLLRLTTTSEYAMDPVEYEKLQEERRQQLHDESAVVYTEDTLKWLYEMYEPAPNTQDFESQKNKKIKM